MLASQDTSPWPEPSVPRSEATASKQAGLGQAHTLAGSLSLHWDLSTLFTSVDHWNREYQHLSEIFPVLSRFKGRLKEPSQFLAFEELCQEADTQYDLLRLYAELRFSVNTTDPEAVALLQRCDDLAGKIDATTAFAEPELISLGVGGLQALAAARPELATYAHHLDSLARRSPHVCLPQVEALLAELNPIFRGPLRTYTTIVDNELPFPEAMTANGAKILVDQTSIDALLASKERDVREAAWNAHTDGFLAMQGTLTQVYLTAVQQSILVSRVRRYKSSLDAALEGYQVPREVFDTAIQQARVHYPLWRRYFEAKAKALGVDRLREHDLFAPLSAKPPIIPYEQAVQMVCDGLVPLGNAYVRTLLNGLTVERWADVYPAPRKITNPFSYGVKGSPPFMLLCHHDQVVDVGTLAHESGHSMHAKFTCESQPSLYTDYSMAVAEVASNFHQALVRAHLLKTSPDDDFTLALLDETFYYHHRYLFLMPILAQFEREVHMRMEGGEGLSAEDLNGIMFALLNEAYGDSVETDPERGGIAWAKYSHLYEPFYTSMYAPGIAASDALAADILEGKTGCLGQYLAFLKVGSSMYPVDALKAAGVDITSSGPYESAFSTLEGFICRLEHSVGH